MPKQISIILNVLACVTFFGGSVKAEITDCVNSLVSRGISRNQAEQACAKASQPARNATSLELYRLCKAAQTGNGNTIYYPNGRVMTSWAGTKGATWYYPNGQIMTSWAGTKGATWYYSNGQIMTSWAGTKGATWYYSNGQIMTSWVGTEGATWYYPNGQIMTSSGNLMSREEMLYPCSYIE